VAAVKIPMGQTYPLAFASTNQNLGLRDIENAALGRLLWRKTSFWTPWPTFAAAKQGLYNFGQLIR